MEDIKATLDKIVQSYNELSEWNEKRDKEASGPITRDEEARTRSLMEDVEESIWSVPASVSEGLMTHEYYTRKVQKAFGSLKISILEKLKNRILEDGQKSQQDKNTSSNQQKQKGLGDDSNANDDAANGDAKVSIQLKKMERFKNLWSRKIEYSVQSMSMELKFREVKLNDLEEANEKLMERCTEDEAMMLDSEFVSLLEMFEKFKSEYYEKVDLHQNNKKSDLSNLPNFKIPIFDGNAKNFVSFKDAFQTVFKGNANLNEQTKLIFLKQHLKNEILNEINDITTETTDCFNIAWSRLNQKYGNKRNIVSDAVEGLLNIPRITRENYVSLKELRDKVAKYEQQIKSINVDLNADLILSQLLLSRLDISSKKEFEVNSSNPEEIPTYEQVVKFLDKKIIALSNTKPTMKNFDNANVAWDKKACVVCKSKDGHYLNNCEKFKYLDVHKRKQVAKDNKLCFLCLNPGHNSPNCKVKWSCRICNKKHHFLLHSETKNVNFTNEEDKQVNQTTKDKKVTFSGNTYNPDNKENKKTILATAIVQVINQQTGKKAMVRCLIDTGSEITLVTTEVMQLLNLSYRKVARQVYGIGETKVCNITKEVAFDMTPRFKSKFRLPVKALVMNNLSSCHGLSETPFGKLRYADKQGTGEVVKVDALLGSDYVYKILQKGLKRKDDLMAQETKFGWIISGLAGVKSNTLRVSSYVTMEQINDKMNNFFNINNEVTDDERAILMYDESTKRNKNGQYVVRLPFKENVKMKDNIQTMAYARFMNMERKMKHDPTLAKHYREFMEKYLENGYMEEYKGKIEDAVFLPHHIISKDSLSTPYRVVFSGNVKGKDGISLNDTLMKGPKIQPDLRDILLRWRTHKFAVIADCQRMYNSVLLHPDDQKYQLIYWRNKPEDKLKIYKLVTVTYGITCSGFLAMKTLHKIADDEAKTQQVKDIIKRDFYVDDLVSGFANETELAAVSKELCATLSKANFKLKKFASNSQKFINEMEGEQVEEKMLTLKDNDNLKALGMRWDTKEDALMFQVEKVDINKKHVLTKRIVLSSLMQIYDPLGLMAPVLLNMKLLIQEIWKEKYEWDAELNSSLHNKWLKYHESLHEINDLRFPRFALSDVNGSYELHAFCDASEKAFAGILYIKTQHSSRAVVNLVQAETHVAPIKETSMPRLELCGALCVAKMVDNFVKCSGIKFQKIVLWCDATIVLDWINSEPYEHDTFINNRVRKIQQLTRKEDWHHVVSENNAADCASRGYSMAEFREKFKQWIHGPLFLKKTSSYQSYKPSIYPNVVNLVKRHKDKNYKILEYFEKYSSLTKGIRILTFVHKFIKLCRKEYYSSFLDLQEEVETKIIKATQQKYFAEDIEKLKEEKRVGRNSNILALNPFLDGSEIIRVAGRISNCHLPYNQRHPIILPQSSHLSKLIALEAHQATFHGQNSVSLAKIREKYWIIRAKNLVKMVIEKCIICTKLKAITSSQLMGQIPKDQLTLSKPFGVSLVDFAGPFNLKQSNLRTTKFYKAYFCLFTCAVTRGVHLEAVLGLDASSFQMALRRFIARRGTVHTIISDNAGNFVKAHKELDNDLKMAIKNNLEDLKETLEKTKIRWKFLPPLAPHQGGKHERMVQTVKYHLKRIVGTTILSLEEFSTLLSEIECIVNSRPLCPLSDQVEDLEFITPSHFLVGSCPALPAEPELENTLPSTRFKLVQKMVQHFWSKYHNHYIAQLQTRKKWKQIEKNVEIGQLCILKEDNTPPLHWKMGRIIKTYKAPDELVRVVDVKTVNGILKRPITKICLLPEDSVIQAQVDEVKKKETSKEKEKSTTKCGLARLLFFLMNLLCMFGIGLAEPTNATYAIGNNGSINVNNGHLTIRNLSQCIFKYSDEVVNWTFPELQPKEIMYGVVEYRCDSYLGYFISNVTCYNEERKKYEWQVNLCIAFISMLVLCIICWSWIIINTSYNAVETDDAERGSRRCNHLCLPLILIFTLLLVKPTRGSDFNLYLASKNTHCALGNCEDNYATQVSIPLGSSIHFQDDNNRNLRIELRNLYQTFYYKKLYYSADFDIKTVTSNLCVPQSNCYHEVCAQNATDEIKEFDLAMPHDEGLDVVDYDCMVQPYICNIHHAVCEAVSVLTKCMMYKWKLVKRNKIPVYKRTGSGWMVDLLITHQNETELVSVAAFHPSQFIRASNKVKVPFLVVSTVFEQLDSSPTVIKYNNNFYEAEASELNFAKKGIIGDVQISLKDNKTTYKKEEVRCIPNGCRVYCITSESGVRRFIKGLENEVAMERTREIYGDMLEYKIPVEGSATILFQTEGLHRLMVHEPQCSLELLAGVACTSCRQMGYVAFRAHSIEEAGMVKVTSNCSLLNDAIACTEGIQKLMLRNAENVCHFEFPTLDLSFTVHIDIIFKGNLHGYDVATNFVQEMDSMVLDGSFFKKLVKQLPFYLSAGCIFLILYRILIKCLFS